MMFARRRPEFARENADESLERVQAEAEREHRLAQQQARAADTAVNALALTRIRNGFAPAIMSGIIRNRKGA